MAKVGEGDARWIVSDRKDGANVNNWHWQEKDVLSWAQQRLEELLGNLDLAAGNSELTASTCGGVKVTGEAIINNRKKKLIALYELEVNGKWTGKLSGSSTAVEGQWKVPYLAEENADEDPEIRFSTSNESEDSQKAKAALLPTGKKVLLSRLQQFVKEIQAGGPVPKDISKDTASTTQAQPLTSKQIVKEVVAPAKEDARSNGRIGKKRKFSATEKFYARRQDIFECFVNPQKITAYTRSPAEVEARKGGKFSMFGGSASGKILEIEAPSKLVLEWRFKNWKAGDVSQVTITLEEPSEGTTILQLSQTGIPDEDQYENADVLETTSNGWKQQVFQRIRAVFGYGLGL